MPSPMGADKPRCGAHSRRTGSPCQNAAMPNGRCRMHGGKSTGAPKDNKNAVTHGIYAVGLRGDEVELWSKVPLGTLDDEIRLTRLQLRRAVELEARWADNPEDPALLEFVRSETSEETGSGAKGGFNRDSATTVKGKPDFRAIFYRLTGRIAMLEMARARLPKAPVVADDQASKKVRDEVMAIFAEWTPPGAGKD